LDVKSVKKNEIAVRSSAAEYLTFAAAAGDSAAATVVCSDNRECDG
jgi:hypothetical protein